MLTTMSAGYVFVQAALRGNVQRLLQPPPRFRLMLDDTYLLTLKALTMTSVGTSWSCCHCGDTDFYVHFCSSPRSRAHVCRTWVFQGVCFWYMCRNRALPILQ